MGVVLDSTVVIVAERAGMNARRMLEDVARTTDDTEATLSVITLLELAQASSERILLNDNKPVSTSLTN